MRFSVTDHAVERYRERHEPHLSYDEARERLLAVSSRAARLKQKTLTGTAKWSDGTIAFLTKPDAGEHVIVTVLPKASSREDLERAIQRDPVLREHVESLNRQKTADVLVPALLPLHVVVLDQAAMDKAIALEKHQSATATKKLMAEQVQQARVREREKTERVKACNAADIKGLKRAHREIVEMLQRHGRDDLAELAWSILRRAQEEEARRESGLPDGAQVGIDALPRGTESR